MINYPAPRLKAYPPPRAANAIYKAASAVLLAQFTETPLEIMAQKMYGKDHDLGKFITRATSSPATLTTPSWAGVVAHDVAYSQLIHASLA
jgi:hypothetical protein